MSEYLIYDKATGQIISSYVGASPELQVNKDQSFIESNADQSTSHITDYVYRKVVHKRPDSQVKINKSDLIADGVDEIIISDSPPGTFTATNVDTGETVTGPINGTDTFTTTVPGKIKIKIESWPYLDFEITITAV